MSDLEEAKRLLGEALVKIKSHNSEGVRCSDFWLIQGSEGAEKDLTAAQLLLDKVKVER